MVQFTPAFKRFVIAEYAQGKRPNAIFQEAGIPGFLCRPKYTKELVRRWTVIARTHGDAHFDQEERGKHGVTLAKWRDKTQAYATMSDKEKVAFLEAEVEALEHIRVRFQLPPSPHSKAHSSRRRTSATSSVA
jgi:hypothetical protein